MGMIQGGRFDRLSGFQSFGWRDDILAANNSDNDGTTETIHAPGSCSGKTWYEQGL